MMVLDAVTWVFFLCFKVVLISVSGVVVFLSRFQKIKKGF